MQQRARKRNKYQLPYPAPFPTWAKYYQPAVTSRPFLTVDDKYAHLSPRLFPVQLAANFLHESRSPPPPPSSSLSPSSSYSISRTNNVNTLRVVPDSASDIPLVAATTDGTLDDLSIYQYANDQLVNVSQVSQPSPARKKRRNSSYDFVAYMHGDLAEIDKINNNTNSNGTPKKNKKKNTVVSDATMASSVYGVQAVECDDDGGLLLAELSDNVCVGRYNSGGKSLVWVEDIALPGLRASCVSPVALTEMVALDKYSLLLYDIATATRTLTADIQPIAPRNAYRWIQYAAHPRNVLLASKRNISRVDLRAHNSNINSNINNNSIDELLDPVRAWNLAANVDDGISYFENHPSNQFMSILATGSILAVIDHRMLRSPLLEWNITHGNDISHAAVMGINEKDTNDVAIAISANVTSDLHVYHVTSDFKVSAEEILANPNAAQNFSRYNADNYNYYYQHKHNHGAQEESEESDDDEEDTPAVNHPHLLWSDMPLGHLEQFPPGNESRGIALVAENKNKKSMRFSLVQASKRYGIMAQRIGIEKFKDGTYAFEAPPDNNDNNGGGGTLLYGVDSAVDILNTRDALLVESQPVEAAGIIAEAVEPGLRIVKRMKCLDMRDVLAARKVLEDAAKDEEKDSRNEKKRRQVEQV